MKPRSKGPRTLDRDYVEHEGARIARQEAEKVEKVAKAVKQATERVAKAAICTGDCSRVAVVLVVAGSVCRRGDMR